MQANQKHQEGPWDTSSAVPSTLSSLD